MIRPLGGGAGAGSGIALALAIFLAVHHGHQHTLFRNPHIAGEIAGQFLHGAGNRELGHKAQPSHIDAQQGDAARGNGAVHPQDGAVAANGDDQVGVLGAPPDVGGILGAQDPAVGAQVELAGNGVGQVKGLRYQVVVGDADGLHGARFRRRYHRTPPASAPTAFSAAISIAPGAMPSQRVASVAIPRAIWTGQDAPTRSVVRAGCRNITLIIRR